MSEHPVVACYHGSDSADAVRLGALLAAVLHEPLLLAGAYRYEPVGLSARAVPVPANARHADHARSALHRARAITGTDVEVREQVVACAGTAAALVTLARDADACLVVLGRDTEGHVTRTLLPQAPCPVAVAPLSVPLAQIDRLERIGVAYDGSPAARRALVAATTLALAAQSRLIVLAAGRSADDATRWLHHAQRTLGDTVDPQMHALDGEATATLTRASGDLDLLVCGSRGRRRPLAALLGSVSTHLVAHARCPVLVVPHGIWHDGADPLAAAPVAARA